MKKKVWSLLLTVMMVLTMFPVGAWAEDEGVLDSGNDGIYKLTEDVTVSQLPLNETGETIIDLNGYTLTYTGGTISFSGSKTLTFMDSSVSGTERGGTLNLSGITGGTVSALNPEKGATVNARNITILCEHGSVFFPRGDAAAVNVESCDVTADVYCVGTNAATTENYKVKISLKDSTFTSEANSWTGDDCPVMINVEGTLDIENCVIEGHRQGVLVRAGTATIRDSSITTLGTYPNKTQYYTGTWGSGTEVPAAALTVGSYYAGAATAYKCNATVTLENTSLTAENDFPALYVDANTSYKATVSINGANSKVSGEIMKGQQEQEGQISIQLSAGLYSVKPDASYLAEGYTTVGSGDASYPYLVQQQESIGSEEEGTEVTVVTEVAKPSVNDSKLNDLTDEEKNAVTTAAESATVSADVMQQESAAALEAVKDAVKEDSSMIHKAVEDVNEITQGEITAEDVTLYVQTYLNIIPTGYNTADKTLTLDITPMSRVVASTASSSDQIVLSEKDGPVNAVIVKETEKKLDIKDSVEMTIELPSDFIENENAYVLHTKGDSKQYVYTGTVAGRVLTFTNPNGFSEFTVYADDPSAARVYAQDESIEENAGIGYMSLQDAVDAVKNGGTIVAKRGGEATVSASKSFTVISGENKIALSAGKNYRRKATDNPDGSVTYTFTYRGSSSSSSSGGSPLPTVGEPTTPSEPSTPSTPSGFVSDTTNDLTVDGVYQFRITSLDGTVPFLTVDNANFRVEFASQEGNDFFFKIHAQGAAGSTTVVSVNGVRLLTATVGGSATGVISDTTAPFTVKKGETYQFRLTASERPSFAAGSASFTVEYAGQIGSDYFYKVYAAGNVGDGCGFYINGEASPVAVATIA